MKDIDSRVMELEIGLAHQQRLCEQLNEVVTQQTQELLKLGKLIPKLKAEIQELKQNDAAKAPAPANEKPPHY